MSKYVKKIFNLVNKLYKTPFSADPEEGSKYECVKGKCAYSKVKGSKILLLTVIIIT